MDLRQGTANTFVANVGLFVKARKHRKDLCAAVSVGSCKDQNKKMLSSEL